MVKIGICIETVFSDLPYEERIHRIAKIGFLSFEFWYHDQRFDGANLIKESKDIDAVAKIARDKKLQVSNFVVNSPDGQIGGSLVKPEDKPQYLARLKEVIPLARKLNCKRMITCAGNGVRGRNYEDQRESIINTLSEASKIVEKEDMILLLEPLNTMVDHPGHFLDSAHEGAKIMREINHPNIQLLFDIYHMQIMEGNILSTIEENIDIIGHFHAAGVPGRHELWMGELNYKNIIKKIDELGYKGYFGLEYFPEIDSEKSLRQTKEYLGQ